MQDAAKEQARRKIQRREAAGYFESGGHAGWRYRVRESYEAAQGWIVVTIIGKARESAFGSRGNGTDARDRCCYWDECGISKHYHGMAFGYKVGALQNGVLSQRKLLLLGRR